MSNEKQEFLTLFLYYKRGKTLKNFTTINDLADKPYTLFGREYWSAEQNRQFLDLINSMHQL
jgi:hypothetical protein